MPRDMEVREFFLSDQLSSNPYVLGPYDVSPLGASIFIRSMVPGAIQVSVEGGEEREGPFYPEYGNGSPIELLSFGTSVITVTGRQDGKRVKYLAFYLDKKVTDGLVKVTVVQPSPLPEWVMKEEVGDIYSWWSQEHS